TEISPVGLRAQGVIAIDLRKEDKIVSSFIIPKDKENALFLMTQRGACKRMNFDLFEQARRARRGSRILRPLKTKQHEVIKALLVDSETEVVAQTKKDKTISIAPYSLPESTLNSNGSFVIDDDLDGKVIDCYIQAPYEQPFANES